MPHSGELRPLRHELCNELCNAKQRTQMYAALPLFTPKRTLTSPLVRRRLMDREPIKKEGQFGRRHTQYQHSAR
jgi:hypothetical protein